MDRRITLQRIASAPANEFNEPVENWTNVAELWAQQRPVRGSERFTAQEIAGQAVMTFHIRHRADVTVKDRISYQGRSWNIVDVREVGRGVVTEIDVVARAEGA